MSGYGAKLLDSFDLGIKVSQTKELARSIVTSITQDFGCGLDARKTLHVVKERNILLILG